MPPVNQRLSAWCGLWCELRQIMPQDGRGATLREL
jgi:hypothetical protein